MSVPKEIGAINKEKVFYTEDSTVYLNKTC